jgi:septal ring factor EnvC (AmiA/AmiB activator)
LSALRLEIDHMQVELTAVHCEAETSSAQLSRVDARQKELQVEQDQVDQERCRVQEQIRAVLMFCGQVPPPRVHHPTTITDTGSGTCTVTAEKSLRQSSQHVVKEANIKLKINDLSSSSLPLVAHDNVDEININDDDDNDNDGDDSLAAIRARIDTCSQTKHSIEQQIEDQHRATHGVQQQFALQEQQLAQSQKDAKTVSSQYGILLRELESQSEEYRGQRQEAERVLRECSFALDMAVDTMNQKVRGQ